MHTAQEQVEKPQKLQSRSLSTFAEQTWTWILASVIALTSSCLKSWESQKTFQVKIDISKNAINTRL